MITFWGPSRLYRSIVGKRWDFPFDPLSVELMAGGAIRDVKASGRLAYAQGGRRLFLLRRRRFQIGHDGIQIIVSEMLQIVVNRLGHRPYRNAMPGHAFLEKGQESSVDQLPIP